MDTVACESPESGESTGSRVHTQRARGGGLGGGGRGGRGGEATLGTKADRTDTSHPLRVRLSLAPCGISVQSCQRYTQLTHSSGFSEPLTESQSTKTLNAQSSSDLCPTFNCFISVKYCFLNHSSPHQIPIFYNTFRPLLFVDCVGCMTIADNIH